MFSDETILNLFVVLIILICGDISQLSVISGQLSVVIDKFLVVVLRNLLDAVFSGY